MRREQEKERDEAVARGELDPDELEELPLPAISYVGDFLALGRCLIADPVG